MFRIFFFLQCVLFVLFSSFAMEKEVEDHFPCKYFPSTAIPDAIYKTADIIAQNTTANDIILCIGRSPRFIGQALKAMNRQVWRINISGKPNFPDPCDISLDINMENEELKKLSLKELHYFLEHESVEEIIRRGWGKRLLIDGTIISVSDWDTEPVKIDLAQAKREPEDESSPWAAISCDPVHVNYKMSARTINYVSDQRREKFYTYMQQEGLDPATFIDGQMSARLIIVDYFNSGDSFKQTLSQVILPYFTKYNIDILPKLRVVRLFQAEQFKDVGPTSPYTENMQGVETNFQQISYRINRNITLPISTLNIGVLIEAASFMFRPEEWVKQTKNIEWMKENIGRVLGDDEFSTGKYFPANKWDVPGFLDTPPSSFAVELEQELASYLEFKLADRDLFDPMNFERAG